MFSSDESFDESPEESLEESFDESSGITKGGFHPSFFEEELLEDESLELLEEELEESISGGIQPIPSFAVPQATKDNAQHTQNNARIVFFIFLPPYRIHFN